MEQRPRHDNESGMKKDSLLPLKILVYSMGILLIGGFVWISGRLVIKAGELSSKDCKEITVPKPAGKLLDTYFSDGHWIIHSRDKQGEIWHRYDSCGKLVQELRVK